MSQLILDFSLIFKFANMYHIAIIFEYFECTYVEDEERVNETLELRESNCC